MPGLFCQTRGMGCSSGLFLVFLSITNVNMLDGSIQGQGNPTDIRRTTNPQMNLQREKGVKAGKHEKEDIIVIPVKGGKRK